MLSKNKDVAGELLKIYGEESKDSKFFKAH